MGKPRIITLPWPDNDVEYLRSNYGSKPAAEIGLMVNRSAGAVRNMAYKLGLTAPNDWAERDIQSVRVAYETAGIGGVVDLSGLEVLIGKGKSEICRKARELGLTNKNRHKIEGGEKDRRKFKGDTDALKEHLSKSMVAHIAKEGHPRGMQGKTHTPEVKRKISKMSVAAWKGKSCEQQEEIINKQIATRVANGTHGASKNKRVTWKAGWRDIGNKRIYFRSRWEANYAHYLEWLKSQGAILEWEYEPKTFWFEAIRRGVRSYKPDFLVTENNGSTAWHEVKGWMDARSKTTLKRMAKYHPDEKIILIDGPVYRSIRLKVMGLIPEWEDSKRDRHA